jgi:Flavoprotein
MSQPECISNKVLYIMSCGSSSGMLVEDLVQLAQAAMWKVCVITTPEGTKFIDIPKLEQLTGYPVRSQYKRAEEPDVLPRADAIVVFPATFNTINKWASGISDTLVVGTLCEYMGLGAPIIAIPCFRTGGGLDGHPIFFKNLEFLQACGVRVIYEPENYPPKNRVPGNVILEELNAILAKDAHWFSASFANNSSTKGKRKNERYYLHTTLPENHTWTDEVCLRVGSVNKPLGSMRIRWYRVDDEPLSLPRIEAEGTHIFFLIPEVFALLDRLGKYVQPSDLCELLQQHFGFTDASPLQERDLTSSRQC